MQVTIARQLGLEPTTVGNFFMNARRRSHDKWREGPGGGEEDDDLDCSDPNIKYEVYECGEALEGGYADEGAYGGGGMMGEEAAYHMTSIPAPVHNPHNQLQSYPSTCA